jgi:hypothetical protein
MELLAVGIMLLLGGAVGAFIALAVTINRRERAGEITAENVAFERDRVAASLLYQVLVSGGTNDEDALRKLRRDAGVAARITPAVDITSWGERYARMTTREQRAGLLDTAVRLAAAVGRPIPLRQYCALLDLSFALGFQTDALARLREQYGFEYVDHAKDARPRDADRGSFGTPLFVREPRDERELLLVLEIEGAPTRQRIISAYRRLVAQHHPDRFYEQPREVQDSAAGRFIEITRAYEELLAIYRD